MPSDKLTFSKLCLNWKMACVSIYVIVFLVLLMGSTVSNDSSRKHMFLAAMFMLGLFSVALLLFVVIAAVVYAYDFWKKYKSPQPYSELQTPAPEGEEL